MRRLPSVTCPKCQNPLQTVDKNGIHIEQCSSCRGIFLDRGELEQIVSQENAFYGAPATPPPYQPGSGGAPRHQPHGGYRDSPRPYGGGQGGHGGYRDSPRPYGHGGHGGHGQRRRKGFLEDLFG